MRLRVSGEGDAAPSPDSTTKSRRGDLYVHIRVLPHKSFVRKGADIHYTASIPLTTAVLGGTVKVPTLDGEVELKVPTGTATSDKITMGGMGMRKIGGRAGSKGDLKVEFKVGMPKSLSASQRTLLEMLADEMGDRTAKRVMGVDRFK
jgi:molecular chaperone DnaJ